MFTTRTNEPLFVVLVVELFITSVELERTVAAVDEVELNDFCVDVVEETAVVVAARKLTSPSDSR